MSFNENHAVETYKSLISISVEGLKTLLLINGGAVVALLAYLGQLPDRQVLAAGFNCSLSLFIIGLVAATAAFFASYFAQLELYDESVHGPKGGANRHLRFFWLTAGLAGFSLVAFAWGAFSALGVFSRGANGKGGPEF